MLEQEVKLLLMLRKERINKKNEKKSFIVSISLKIVKFNDVFMVFIFIINSIEVFNMKFIIKKFLY